MVRIKPGDFNKKNGIVLRFSTSAALKNLAESVYYGNAARCGSSIFRIAAKEQKNTGVGYKQKDDEKRDAFKINI